MKMELPSLADLYKGKMAFVVGSGPSLHFQDVSPLQDFVTISVNSSFPKVSFSDVFVGDDLGLKNWSYFVYDLKKSNCIKLLYEEKLKDYAYHLNSVIFFNHKWWYSPSDKAYNHQGLVLTKNPWKPIIGARTTSGSALHFAYIMGCDPIVLLGMDCCYSRDGSKRYYWQFEGEKSVYRITGEPVFSHPNQGKHKATGMPIDKHCLEFLEYWDLVSRQTKKQGINVINASGGILNCFPHMSLEEVVKKYSNRKK